MTSKTRAEWRQTECPQLRLLTGTVIGTGTQQRIVVWAVSAGELLDELAHRQIWKRGSSAEACALHGDSRFWERGGKPQGR